MKPLSVLLCASVAGNLAVFLLLMKGPEPDREPPPAWMRGAPEAVPAVRHSRDAAVREGVSDEDAGPEPDSAEPPPPDRVEVPWELARLFGMAPLSGNGLPTREFIKCLGLTPAQAQQISGITRAAVEAEAEKTAGSVRMVTGPDGRRKAHLEPRENHAVREMILRIGAMNLPQFPVIKSMLEDSANPDIQTYHREIWMAAGEEGGVVVRERMCLGEREVSSQQATYRHRNSMATDYGLIYDRYFLEK